MQRVGLWLSILLLIPSLSSAVTEIGSDVLVWPINSGLDADGYQPSSAVNDVDDHYLLVWSQDEGDAGFRIFGGIIDGATSGAVSLPAPLDSGVGNARECAAAFDPVRLRYLVVWSQDAGEPGCFEIHGILLANDMSPVGPPFQVSEVGIDPTDPAFDAVRPRVAADGEGNFLVVWAADDDDVGFGDGVFDIYSRKVSSSGQLAGAANQRVTDVSSAGSAPTNDALDPVLVFNPVQENFAMIYEGDLDGGTFYDPNIWLLVLGKDGVPKTAAQPVRLSPSSGASKDDDLYFQNPEIAYDTRQKQMLVVWDASNGLEPGISGRMIFSDYTLAPGGIQISEISTPPAQICIARDPTVTYNLYADRFLVAWSGSLTPALTCPQDREILVREVDRDGTVLGGIPLVISDPGVSVDPRLTATSPNLVPNPVDETILAWWSADRDNIGEFELFGQFLGLDPATAVEDNSPELPMSLELKAAPNPFNPATTLHFALPTEGPVRLAIYDVRGALVRVVVDEALPAGRYERRWSGTDGNGRSVASGVYFTRLEHASGTRRGSLVLLK